MHQYYSFPFSEISPSAWAIDVQIANDKEKASTNLSSTYSVSLA